MFRCVFVYYKRSAIGLVLALAGCAGPNQIAERASRVDFQELSGPNKKAAMERLIHFPSIIHFRAGERVPVEFVIDSELATLEVKEMTLVAKRDFYLLLRPDGAPLFSRDGVDFEEKHQNSFSAGFAVTKQAPAHVEIKLGVWAEQVPR